MNPALQRSAQGRLVTAGRRLCPSVPRHVRIRTASYCSPTVHCQLPMKPGSLIAGLDFIKDKEPVVAKERGEYPEWVGSLAQTMPSLARLRKMPDEEATDREKERYLKLTRRQQMKKNNEEAGI